MIRRIAIALAIASTLLVVTGCGGEDQASADYETGQIEANLGDRAGGIADCVQMDNGDRYKCVVRTAAGEQLVNVDCGSGDCIYEGRP